MDEPVTLRLTLVPGPGPIAGALEHKGESVEFSGWIELVSLIEARRPNGGAAGTDLPQAGTR